MGYRAYGVLIEGIGAGDSGAICWAGGWPLTSGLTLSVEGRLVRVTRDALAMAPQLSATELDPLTGALRSGAIQITLHATPAVTAALLAQAIARQPATTLQAALTAGATSAQLAPAPSVGALLHLGEEVIGVVADLGGGVYQISRALSGSIAAAHAAGLNAYAAPPWWVGRQVTLITMDATEAGGVVGSPRIVWRGYMTEPPQAARSSATVVLRAEDALATLRRVEINRNAAPYNASAPLPVQGTTQGLTAFGELVPRDLVPRVRKLAAWASGGAIRAMQIGQSVELTLQDVTPTGQPELGSPRPTDPDAPLAGPYWELAVWSRQLDDHIANAYGEGGVSPTLSATLPHHPLTIAAALLGSSTDRDTEDPLVYDLLQPEWSAGVGYLLDTSAFTQMITRTSHLEVDRLVLGWDGQRVDVYRLITEQLLPAYGFALSPGPTGLLRPILIGPADVQDYASAAQVEALPGSWEWESGIGGALDALTARIGALPWREGREIVVTGQGERTNPGGRATRVVTPRTAEYEFPSIAPTAAEGYGATELTGRLIWRYDGLPRVRCQLPEGQTAYWVGQWVRVQKPDGLLSNILFDRAGARSDAWDTQPYLGQVMSVRYDVQRGRWDVELLLANFALGRAMRWRAPSARIKSIPSAGVYRIAGVGDFDGATSDALTLAVGDQVRAADEALAPGAEVRTITAITAAGSDWDITLSSNFGSPPAVGGWLQLATSANYTNPAILGAAEPYPYAFMTDDATLARPGGADIPDEFA